MIKSMLKWLGIGVASVVTIGAGLAAHEWYAEKPFFYRAYLDRAMVKMAFDSPETLTSLGFLESMGINGHNAHLDNEDPAETQKMLDELDKFHQGLLQYDMQSLDANQQYTQQITLYLLDLFNEFKPYIYHNYPANQMFGIQSGFPSFMQSSHQINSVEDAEHYLSRLGELNRKFSQYLIGLKLREEKGIIPPKFVIQRVLDEMHGFVDTPAKENILYTSFSTKLDKVEGLTDAEKSTLLGKVETAIGSEVYPAYGLFIDYFTVLVEKAGTDDGYWHLPNGDKAYQLALKFFTTTDYTPDELHQLGVTEVARIQQEMMAIFTTLGIDTSQGFLTAMNTFKANPDFYYEDSDEAREQILKDYQTILDEIDAGLGDAFNIRPKAGMEVVRIPEFKEKTAPGAYYEPPSLDGTRLGRFYANLYDVETTPKYAMRTLAYHEGIPGHHFQIAIAMELEGMPLIRRFAPFTAYTEGWALYAERLGFELGFMKDPADNIGRLTDELLRAVRLVVDTGLHAKRWTREQGIDYMYNNTGRAERDIVSEVERYIVMPGQATAYKVGMIKILELREKAKAELGDKFILAEFHDAVLKNGAMPLALLEKVIDQYIEDKKAA